MHSNKNVLSECQNADELLLMISSIRSRLCMLTGHLVHYQLFITQSRLLTTLRKKPLWEKEKMIVTSIFSFSHHAYYPSQKKKINFSVASIFLSANAFNLHQSEILSIGKELTERYDWLNIKHHHKIS